jgi:hypothetical protein
MPRSVLLACAVVACTHCRNLPAEMPTGAETSAALRRAVEFFHDNCAKHGGYDWRYSHDLKLTEGEAETDADTIWVQPPGTPAVGLVLLDAYDATGDRYFLDVAREVANALVSGQMQSGGWCYSIRFDPGERRKWAYRDNPGYRTGRGRKDEHNLTIIDDDTTPAVIRFLVRIDKTLEFRDQPIHDAVKYALDSLLIAQYPVGGWSHNYDRYPAPHSTREFPVLKASYPETWSRKWLNDWPGRYYTNDNISGRMLEAMLVAWEVYADERCLASARKTGEFFRLAQLPDPQPAWAQQYDPAMHPCWDRKFEPPAVSSLETEYTLDALLLLYRNTGDKQFLEPVPQALAWMKRSQLPNGRLARFYELRTNRPLYFTKDYELTYNADDVPTHYGFEFDSRLDELDAEYRRLLKDGPSEPPPAKTPAELAAQVRTIIDSLDERGGWLDSRGMRGYRKASQEGVYQSETFITNVTALCQYLARMK